MLKRNIKNYLLPGTCVFFDGKSFISTAIKYCQDIYTKKKFHKKSQWSHIGWIGSDGYFYESTFDWKGKLINGVVRKKVEKRFKKLKDYHKLGFQKLLISTTAVERITEEARLMWKKKYKYGTLELFGTLWVLLKWRWLILIGKKKKAKKLLQNNNPLDKVDSMYCIAFVTNIIENSGLNYINVDESISTVDEGWLACQLPVQYQKIIRIR